MTTSDVERLARCCDTHDDWPTLAEHLVEDFAELTPADVARELTRAKSAAESFGLERAEQIAIAELMARHQLMLLSGRTQEVARLDPEQHVRTRE